MLIISYYGDSTLFREKYEIDFDKRKVFSISPNISYLHIKGRKLRTKIKLNNKEWKTVSGVVLMIDFERLRVSAQTTEQKSVCSVERILVDNETVKFRMSEENIPQELRTIFETIRNFKFE